MLSYLDNLALVDHHCHGLVRRDLDRASFEALLTEAAAPAPGTTLFDSQVGLAVRRWCAPVLDLPPHAGPESYLSRRAELGADEVNRRFVRAAGISTFCVDAGYAPEPLTSAADLAALAGGRAYDVVRLERLAEAVAVEVVDGRLRVQDFCGAVRERLAAGVGAGAVATKTIAAYRVGLDLPADRPTDAEATDAAGRWSASMRAGGSARLADATLHAWLVWCGADTGLPVQVHTGYGDTDLDLHRCNPLLLTGLLRALEPTATPVMLLHCYPYHRQAGYLAQVFPHVFVDVGLATHGLGSGSAGLVAQALELAPFGKFLFSSDAYGLAELYLLGAHFFRRGLASFLQAGVDAGEWSAGDAERIAHLAGAGNACRVYSLPDTPLAAGEMPTAVRGA